MKKKMLLFAAFALLSVFAVNAQGGGMQRMPIPDRVKMVMDKLADFKMDKDKTALTDSAFTNYYRSQQKMMEDRKKLADERDDKLKKIFTDEQFKKWKDEIEPTTRPQRGGGGGNN